MPIRNRQKLMNMDLYDLLSKMNKELQECSEKYIAPCIMDALNVHGSDRSEICNCDCEQCIAKWLNMKE